MVDLRACLIAIPFFAMVACSGGGTPTEAPADASTDAYVADAAPPDAPGDERDAATSADAGPLTSCPVSGPKSFNLASAVCFTLTPAETGAGAAGENATVPSYAVAPQVGARGALLLWFNGSGGHPGGKEALPDPAQNFYAAAASLGYAVLGVSYVSNTSVGSLCKGTDPCFFATRKSIILGVPEVGAAAAVATIAKDEGIVERVVLALAYLEARDPSHGWGTFLASHDTSLPPQERIRWSKVTVAGHSQGGGHAALLAKLFPVARAIQLSSTCDNVNGTPASWTAASNGPWASDPSQFYGLAAPTTFANGAPTGGDITCPYHAASWQSEGMIPSHQNDAAASCGQAGDTHNVSAGCTQNYPAWQAMLQ